MKHAEFNLICKCNLKRKLNCSNVGSRCHFTREFALNDEYLSQLFLDRKVLLMTLEQLMEILQSRLNSACFIASEHYISAWVFVNFKSVRGEETQIFLREPSHAWMESI